MKKYLEKIFSFLFLFLAKVRRLLGIRLSARKFSNNILKKYLKHFSGAVINVSGWEDKDKEGGYYRDYYKSVSEYYISNIKGDQGQPEIQRKGNNYIFLDLEKELDKALINRFDIVFNHTVLEHVYDTQTAMKNLISMTRDLIIIVVPFLQGVHFTDSYSDYYRFTPFFFKKFLEDNGFNILLCEANEQLFDNIYLVIIASKNIEKYKHLFNNNLKLSINRNKALTEF